MPKIDNAGLEAKAKAWTYEAKVIKIRCQGASRPCLCVCLSAKLLADSQTQWI